MRETQEVARVSLPTPFGEFDTRAFECPSGSVYLALTRGDLHNGRSVLTRLHSTCLTGDALGSLRCDCGVQLQLAMRTMAAEGQGILLYATGQEGRGIGLVNKLRAYAEQDNGLDTLDANLRLGLPVDCRDYREAGTVLAALGVRSVRLLTNNPAKVEGVREAGIEVESVLSLATAPHARNIGYLRTKSERLGHQGPLGEELSEVLPPAVDASLLLGSVASSPGRPYVVLKYAQTLDGRIATRSGDSRWISGERERTVSHALRASCDAVLVGIGTVLRDDPELTVRRVPGASPLRVVLDSTLRVPPSARVLGPGAATLVLTTERSRPSSRSALRAEGVGVRVVRSGPGGVDVEAALDVLAEAGVRSLLVEGGAKVITSMLAAGVVDRLIVGVAPRIIGSGTEAVGDLGTARLADGMRLANRAVHVTPEDVLMAFDVVGERLRSAPVGASAGQFDFS
ncbi:MAG: GTP cyclohydrolase II RibA [Actinomycetota bacterium]|nr:GTP cyclohydrolase II RibA [Actinomycetota bacterium]